MSKLIPKGQSGLIAAVDFVTDMLPVIGDAKALVYTGQALKAGELGEAAMHAASLLPMGKLGKLGKVLGFGTKYSPSRVIRSAEKVADIAKRSAKASEKAGLIPKATKAEKALELIKKQDQDRTAKAILDLGENHPAFNKHFEEHYLLRDINTRLTTAKGVEREKLLEAQNLAKEVIQDLKGTPTRALTLTGNTTNAVVQPVAQQLEKLADSGDSRSLVLYEVLQDQTIHLPTEFVRYVESIFKFGNNSVAKRSKPFMPLDPHEVDIVNKGTRAVSLPQQIQVSNIFWRDKWHVRPTGLRKPAKSPPYTKEVEQEISRFCYRAPRTTQEAKRVDRELDQAISYLRDIVRGDFKYTTQMQDAIFSRSTGTVPGLSYSYMQELDRLGRKNFGHIEQPNILNALLEEGHLPGATKFDEATDLAVMELRRIRKEAFDSLDPELARALGIRSPEDLKIRAKTSRKSVTKIPVEDWSTFDETIIPQSLKVTKRPHITGYGFYMGEQKVADIPRKELHHALIPLAQAEAIQTVLSPGQKNPYQLLQAIQRTNKGADLSKAREYYRSHQILTRSDHILAHELMELSKSDLSRIKQMAASGRFESEEELIQYIRFIKNKQKMIFNRARRERLDAEEKAWQRQEALIRKKYHL